MTTTTAIPDDASKRLRRLFQTQPQEEFRGGPEWIRGFVAGRGSGKTLIGARDVLLRARAGEPWMSVSPSYGVIHETTMPTMEEEARRLDVFVRLVKSPHPRLTFATQDGGLANIVFRSGDDPDKLRGPNKAGLWIDEASILHPNVFLLGMATLRFQGRMGALLLTFTPKGRNHWTFDCFFEIADSSKGRVVEDDEGQLWLVQRGRDDDEDDRWRQIHTYSGINYTRKPDTRLVYSHTRDNPFLPELFYARIRSYYSAQLARQELAGEFVDIEGLMFRRSWFQMVIRVPRLCQRVRYWDRAATEDGGSYSAGVLIARDEEGIFYVEDVVRGQWTPHERDSVMKQVAEQDAEAYDNEVLIYVEQEGGSGGKEVAQQALVKLAGHPVFIDLVTGSRVRRKDHQTLPGEAKVVRAQPFAAQCQAGRVRILKGAWNQEYLEELCAFPEYAVDDQVDASSGAFNKLTKMNAFVGSTISRTEYQARAAETKYGMHHERGKPAQRPHEQKDRNINRASRVNRGAHRRPSKGS